ncbi:hypothetical protein [Henriciella sp.]|uniref:hypothetical protein n=1 Tax=Henriciella sp. TaxID=1968823 RepID=UPI00262D4E13|nr:hypothetical protein [Henriciella sp.]
MTMKPRSGILLLAIAIGQWTAPLLPFLGLGQTIGAQARDGGIPPELPPGPFFSIWSVIFALYLGFAVLAIMKPGHLERRLAPPLILAGLASIGWMLAAQLMGNEWLNFVVLIPLLIFAWESSFRLHRMGGWDGTARRLLAAALTGLLSGWAVVAVSISLPRLMRILRDLEPTDQVWVSLCFCLIPAAILTWLYTRWVSRGLFYFTALGWGLAGIAINNWIRLGTHGLAIVTVLAGLYLLWHRLTHGARPAFE